MKVVKVDDLKNTEREVICPKNNFISLRILLESDSMGYTLTKTIVNKGGPYFWHYKNHLESCYCISGRGIVTNEKTKEQFIIEKDFIYILDDNDAHSFLALEETILICVFNPPLKGREVHSTDGSYER